MTTRKATIGRISLSSPVALYLRISQDKALHRAKDAEEMEVGLAVSRQREECMDVVNSSPLTIGREIVEYCDNDRSATNRRKPRPEFKRLLADIKAGKVDTIVCWDKDRFLRRPDEAEKVIDLAEQLGGLHVLTFTGPPIDLMTPSGQLMLRQMVAFARYEMQHKGERQKSQARQSAKLGIPAWKTSFGFTEDGTRQPHPTEAPLVKQAYTDVLAGRSVYAIGKEWDQKGVIGRRGASFTTSTLSKFLRNPRNAGLRDQNGVIVGPGNWPALVDKTIWTAVQAILNRDDRKPGPKTVRAYLLSGRMTCSRCGDAKLMGQPRKPYEPPTDDRKRPGPKPSPEHRDRDLYQCKKCLGVSIKRSEADALILAVLAKRLSRPDARELLHTGKAPDLDRLRVEADAIRETLNELATEEANEKVNARLEGREPKSKAEFRAARESLTTRLKAIEAKTVDGTRAHIFRNIPLGTEAVGSMLSNCPEDRLRSIIQATMKITVVPPLKGGNRFDPDRIKIEWL